MYPFQRTPLSYPFEALEPFIDAKTMEIHSEKHHQAYTDKLNAALEKYPDLHGKEVEELLRGIDSIPEEIRTAVRNNGGGFINHNVFFSILKKNEGGIPVGELAEEINKVFGSFEKFKEQFSTAAAGQFGSGWAWLATDMNGDNLHIHALPNQDSSFMHNHFPILGIDVWEHAYYLKYQNRRPEYIEAFFNIIDWEKVNERFLMGKKQ